MTTATAPRLKAKYQAEIRDALKASLGVTADVGLKTTFVEPPKPRAKGIVVKDVAELVDALKKKGLV